MFLTSAFALLIQPDLNLFAYDDSLNNSVASKIELTIPEISKRELNKVRREEAKRLKNKKNKLKNWKRILNKKLQHLILKCQVFIKA